MNPTHLIITNRTAIDYGAEALPRRIHIVPRGELPNREAGLVQVLDDAALDSIFADLTQHKAQRGGLYLGEEHFIYNDEKSSEAFAWAKEFEKDAQGIWAVNPEYTDVGAAAIRNKRFKWTSFVADRRDTQDLGNGRVRILKLDTVGFTNQANGKELLTPVCNRTASSPCSQHVETGDAMHVGSTLRAGDSARSVENIPFAGAGASAANHKPQTKGSMKNIATKLGLAAEASEEAVLAAVTQLMNRADAAEASAKEVPALKNRLAVLDGEQVDTLLAEHGVKEEKTVARLKPALLPLLNRDERVEYLTDLGFKPGEQKTAPQGRILNRAELKTEKKEALPTDEQTLAAKAEAEVTAYRLQNRCSYAAARNAVRALKPELFGLAKS